MKVVKFNVSKPKKYIKDGVEKTQWNNIGTITEFHKDDGSVSKILEIPAIGLDANIFPFTEKTPVNKSEEVEQENNGEFPEEEINPDDIPF